MADKLKAGISVVTTFVDGESPSAAKLNSIGAQLENATRQLEKALGDLHDESYPYSTSSLARLSPAYGHKLTANAAVSGAVTRSLDIVSLGRLLGPASNLNPHYLASDSISESVPTSGYEYSLRLPYDGAASTLVFSDGTVFSTLVATPQALNAAGEYYVDSDGRVYSFTEMNGGIVTYTTDPTKYAGGSNYQNARFNVIPDPYQLTAGGSGVSIGAPDASGARICTLPTCTHMAYNQASNSTVLGGPDVNQNQQLYLPAVLVNNYVAGETIPEGFLFLKNATTSEVYKTATYEYNDNKSIVISGIDITDDVDAGHDFVILTVGTDVTSSIDDLRKKLYHDHDRTFGEPLIPVESLWGATRLASNTGQFGPSEIAGNFAPQYLHRDGYTGGVDQSVNDSNALRGDLYLGNSDGTPGTYLIANTGDSFMVRWKGPNTTQMWQDSSGALNILNTGGTYAEGVRIKSSPLVVEKGLRAVSSNSYQTAIAPISKEFEIAADSTGSGINFIDFDAELSAAGDADVYQVSVFVQDHVIAGRWWTPSADSNYGYDVTFIDSTDGSNPNSVKIYWNGGVWNGTNVDVRVVVWYKAN